MKKILFGFAVIFFIIAGGLLYLGSRPSPKPVRQVTKLPDTKITLIEGWTQQDMANYLEKNNITKSADFLKAVKNYDISAYPLLGSKPASQGLEGFLFPDTYFIPAPTAANGADMPAIIIGKMLDNFSAKFTPAMQSQAQNQKLTVYQIVTLASIIEKETGRNAITQQQKDQLDRERKNVASVFYNRLQIGMPLQSDATVNYITGKNMPQPLLDDTQIDNPYNTYKYKGLPPGPICNPSLSSLVAALYPAQTGYFYFLTRPDTGQAVFSQTYEQQQQNKQKYLN